MYQEMQDAHVAPDGRNRRVRRSADMRRATQTTHSCLVQSGHKTGAAHLLGALLQVASTPLDGNVCATKSTSTLAPQDPTVRVSTASSCKPDNIYRASVDVALVAYVCATKSTYLGSLCSNIGLAVSFSITAMVVPSATNQVSG